MIDIKSSRLRTSLPQVFKHKKISKCMYINLKIEFHTDNREYGNNIVSIGHWCVGIVSDGGNISVDWSQ